MTSREHGHSLVLKAAAYGGFKMSLDPAYFYAV
jgi:hypothetical protein